MTTYMLQVVQTRVVNVYQMRLSLGRLRRSVGAALKVVLLKVQKLCEICLGERFHGLE